MGGVGTEQYLPSLQILTYSVLPATVHHLTTSIVRGALVNSRTFSIVVRGFVQHWLFHSGVWPFKCLLRKIVICVYGKRPLRRRRQHWSRLLWEQRRALLAMWPMVDDGQMHVATESKHNCLCSANYFRASDLYLHENILLTRRSSPCMACFLAATVREHALDVRAKCRIYLWVYSGANATWFRWLNGCSCGDSVGRMFYSNIDNCKCSRFYAAALRPASNCRIACEMGNFILKKWINFFVLSARWFVAHNSRLMLCDSRAHIFHPPTSCWNANFNRR